MLPHIITATTGLSKEATYFDVYTPEGMLVRRHSTTLKGLREGVYIINGRKMLVKNPKK